MAKYVTGPGIYNVCHPVLVNLDTWNKIPVRIQGLLTAVMMQEERAVVARDSEEIRMETEALKAAGVTFIEFSPSDSQRYIDLSQSSGWEGLLQRSGNWGPTLQKLLSK